MNQNSTDLRRFYDEQLELIRKGDVAVLVETHYHADAVLMTPDRIVRGVAALKEMFGNYIPTLGDFVVKTEAFTACGNIFLVEAEINPGPQSRRVYDAFVLEGGRIIFHFAGVFR
jgi:ketosteroid isomerase-like protein